MSMREAFENYYGGDKRRSVRHPETYIDFTTQTVWESFESGYAAAIEAVKAGGVVAFAVTNFDGRILQLSVTQDPFYPHSTPLYCCPEHHKLSDRERAKARYLAAKKR